MRFPLFNDYHTKYIYDLHSRCQHKTHVFIESVRYCCPIWTNIWIRWETLVILFNITFHRNPCSWSRLPTGGHTDMTKLTGVCLQVRCKRAQEEDEWRTKSMAKVGKCRCSLQYVESLNILHGDDRRRTKIYSQREREGAGIATSYGLGGREVGVPSPGRVKNFLFSTSSITGSGVHLTSYPMGTGGSFPGGNAAGVYPLL
jgi:hypothetical protein